MAGVGVAMVMDAVEEVRVDHATLRVVEMGSRGPGYAVRLLGELDPGWVLRFRNLRTHSPVYLRFILDPEAATVSFPLRVSDGPADVIEALETLDLLVERANTLSRS